MFFEVLSPIYHSPITIELLTYRVLLGVPAYSSRGPHCRPTGRIVRPHVCNVFWSSGKASPVPVSPSSVVLGFNACSDSMACALPPTSNRLAHVQPSPEPLHISPCCASACAFRIVVTTANRGTCQTVGTVPPSITYSVPVMAPARGDATNAMSSATSRGLAGRPSGMPPSDRMMICLPPS
jgi:hypothetical protein